MSTAGNTGFLQQLVQDLLKAKTNHYSEQCIPYYLEQHLFLLQDLPKVYNSRQERLKCTLVTHRKDKHHNKMHKHSPRCILYLHGLGSSRLEALSIAQQLPKHYSLCMFDMSGSGKSQGDYVTYGMKEQEDIQAVINYLHKKKHIKEFVLWGRSMGAVATLLYAEGKHSVNKKQRQGLFSNCQSLRNSIVRSPSRTHCEPQESLVKAIVLDSPFHNFKDIAREIATKKMGLPTFLLDIGLNYVEQSFTKILTGSIGQQYNPFKINFSNEIHLDIPIILLSSEKDEIVLPHHCQQIMKKITSQFQRIPINQCTHNQVRPAQTTLEVFMKLDKFNRQSNYENKKLNQSLSKDLTMSYSVDKKRGLFVYTPSREKDKRSTIDRHEQPSFNLLRQTVQIQAIKTEDPLPQHSPRSKTSVIRKPTSGLKLSRHHKQKKYEPILGNDNFLSSLNTIDVETTKMLNQKLSDIKERETHMSKIVRYKHVNNDKRREIKLSHHRYLA